MHLVIQEIKLAILKGEGGGNELSYIGLSNTLNGFEVTRNPFASALLLYTAFSGYWS